MCTTLVFIHTGLEYEKLPYLVGTKQSSICFILPPKQIKKINSENKFSQKSVEIVLRVCLHFQLRLMYEMKQYPFHESKISFLFNLLLLTRTGLFSTQ